MCVLDTVPVLASHPEAGLMNRTRHSLSTDSSSRICKCVCVSGTVPVLASHPEAGLMNSTRRSLSTDSSSRIFKHVCAGYSAYFTM
jgi:hypothetical protein